MHEIEPLLSDSDLEKLTGRSRSAWQKDRLQGGPGALPFIRVGRLIRYRQSDVEAWLDARRHSSTSEKYDDEAA